MASAWINQIFQAGQASQGNIVRRAKADVVMYASMAELIAEVKALGFHMIEVGDQVIVICNSGTFKLIC